MSRAPGGHPALRALQHLGTDLLVAVGLPEVGQAGHQLCRAGAGAVAAQGAEPVADPLVGELAQPLGRLHEVAVGVENCCFHETPRCHGLCRPSVDPHRGRRLGPSNPALRRCPGSSAATAEHAVGPQWLRHAGFAGCNPAAQTTFIRVITFSDLAYRPGRVEWKPCRVPGRPGLRRRTEMTEDQNQNDQTTGQPRRAARSPRPRATAAAETAGQAIPLPAVTPPTRRPEAFPLPQQPDTPPDGRAAGTDPPAGHHPARAHPAAGHVRHGRPGRQPDAGRRRRHVPSWAPRPPTPAPRCGPRPPAPAPRHQRQPPRPQRPARRQRPPSPSSAAGVGIGHAAWTNGNEHRRPLPPRRARTRAVPLGAARVGSGTPFGNGSPFGAGLRQLGQLGQLGQLRAAATRDRPTPRARATSTPSRPRSTPGSSTSTRRSATSRSRRPARASC